jgi:adenosyl cobinamide kinase/adenosyl cobinamide phosphate guanylyltransferase
MLTLVLGGTSSGKSRFAVDLARQQGGQVLFVATGHPSDEEMAARIVAHRRERPRTWLIKEEPWRLEQAIQAHPEASTVLIDSIDGWVANHMEEAGGDQVPWIQTNLQRSEMECRTVLEQLPSLARRVICVSSEVGMSPIALNAYGRAFVDLLGRINQRLNAIAAERYLIVAGCPLPLHFQPEDQ